MEHKEVKYAKITLDEREEVIIWHIANNTLNFEKTDLNLEDLGEFIGTASDKDCNCWLEEANEDIESNSLGKPADDNEALDLLEKLNNLFAVHKYSFLNIEQMN